MTVRLEAHASRLALQWVAQEPERRHRRLHGGLLTLDLTGFTTLTERLAALGPVGAEEVTAVIDATLDRLLAPVAEDDGHMLAFGGDAVLVLFEGHEAGARAARAAHRMRVALLAGNPVQTRAGPLRLGARVAVHIGAVDLVLAGGTTRELVVVGPEVSAVLRAGRAAGPDEVVVTPALAASLPADCLGAPRPEGVPLLGEPPAPSPIAGSDGGEEGPHSRDRADVARGLLSSAVVSHLLDGGGGGAHRTATVAFVTLSGTDALAGGGGGDLADAVEEVVGRVQRAAEAQGVTLLGTDAAPDGASLLLAGGVPRGTGDEDDRMLLALREVVGAPLPLAVRAGVARGPVFAGALGPAHRRTYTILGDVVNLAARVTAHAGVGEVRATPEPLNAARTLFETLEQTPFTAKGKAQPVRTYTVGAEVGIRLRLRPDDHTFVGRREQLARLGQLVDGLTRGRGALVLVTGPAGVGKSRLIDELQHRHPRTPAVLAACQETSAGRPRYAALQWLRALVAGDRAAADDAVLRRAAALIPAVPGLDVDHLPLVALALGTPHDAAPAARRATAGTADVAPSAAMIDDVVMSLVQAARPGPLVLVCEDAQWLDASSTAILRQLASRLTDLPWLVVVTARDAEGLASLAVDGADVHRIDLGPLPLEDARSLVLQDVERRLVDLDRLDELLDRGEGNPLFLIELAATAAVGGEGSDQIEGVLRQRLDLLSAADRRVVEHAAVLGVEFPADLLAATADGDALGAARMTRLHDLLRRTRSGSIRFNQTLYQEVAYAAIPFRTRAAMHAAAARAVTDATEEIEDVDGQLSRHWAHAGDGERAWQHSLAAARQAVQRGAPGDAALLYRRALDAGVDRPPREIGRVRVELGSALHVAGAYEAAADVLELAADALTGDESVAATVERTLALQAAGDFAQSVALLEGVDAVEGSLRGRVLVSRSMAFSRMGRTDEALAAAEDAIAVADPVIRAKALMAMAWAMEGVGDPDAGELAAEAATALEEIGDRAAGSAWIQHGTSMYYDGRWDQAVVAYQRAADFERRTGGRANQAVAELDIAEIRSDQGRLAEAGPQLSTCLATLTAAGSRGGASFARLLLGRLAARSGRHDEAEALLAQALAVLAQIGSAHHPFALAVHAEAALFAGDHDLAAARSAPLLERPGQPVVAPLIHRVAGLAAWASGRQGRAESLLTAARRLGEHEGLVYERLLTAEATAAVIGGPPEDVPGADRLGVVAPRLLAIGPSLLPEMAPQHPPP